MSIDVIKGDLKSNNIRKIYLFFGAEEYLKKFYLKKIEDTLLKDDFKELNKIVINDTKEVSKIIDSCEICPVFSEKKLVIVMNSGLFNSKNASGVQKKTSKNHEFIEYLKDIPDYTCLVFYENEVDKRLGLVDFIKKNGGLVEFPVQSTEELSSWVMKIFKSHQKVIDKNLAVKLVEYCDFKMTKLLFEIDKIVLYLDAREKITQDDIDFICTKSINVKVFDLTDAIAKKDGKRAFRLLNELIDSKESLSKIYIMIVRQLRQMLEAKLLFGRYLDVAQIAQKLGVSAYIAKKIHGQSETFSTDFLKKAYEKCHKIDLDIKNGRITDRLAVETLIAELM